MKLGTVSVTVETAGRVVIDTGNASYNMDTFYPITLISDRRTGKIWAKKFTVAHDCGLIINLDGLRRCIEGNVVQGTSRALSEEVAFDRTKVTSTDWLSCPILDITEAPETVDILLINRPDLPPADAGESSIRPVAAALANAVFDATGVRLRRAPLTPQRLKPALA
jgi:nicotinate dehydrogenase subunit B